MASRRHERTAARQSALQVLYTSEIKGTRPSDLLDSGLVLEDDGKSLSDYAIGLIEGVDEKMLPIDVRLNSTSENWKLNRMPIVDRTIMAVALFEMFMQDDTPVSVAISEAVEISKLYGGDDSSNFVNGILGDVARLAQENPGASLAVLANKVAEAAAEQKDTEVVEAADSVDELDEIEGDIEDDIEDFDDEAVVDGGLE